jgi:hypothetical protein
MRLIFMVVVVAFFAQCQWKKNVNSLTQSDPTMVINELMSDNKSTIYDEKHEADDWIELYNTGKSSTNLKGLFLSNDSTKLDKFPLPDTLVPSHGYIVIWADNDDKQGSLHAPFKLSKDDPETIFLTQGANTIVNRILLPDSTISEDESYGRWTDGAETWGKQKQPTPGSANSGGQ